MSATVTTTAHARTRVVEADYSSHPADLVAGGEINSKYTVSDLRNAIPAHCFRSSYWTSLWYLARDLTACTILAAAACVVIPRLETPLLRFLAWLLYGYVQGQQMTGLWVLGHECGHGAFSPSPLLNNTLGFILHSALLTPYFSWRSTHRRHHIYANNLAKDHNYVPPTRASYIKLFGKDITTMVQIEEMAEDSPIATLGRLVLQQLLGWPWYLLTNITATGGSLASTDTNPSKPSRILPNSHFNPHGTLFRPEEATLILISDIGIIITLAALYHATTLIGFQHLALLYIQPYLWVNHWIVAITYLHHTSSSLPKYLPAQWTFLKGATATIDRGLGFGGRHLMHNIADYHVIHHLFPRIPQYHAREATEAVRSFLGDSYREDKGRSFWVGLWEVFRGCQYVEESGVGEGEGEGEMRWRGGKAPPVEVGMGRGGVVEG